jgi:peptide/nickel transport system permease protein
VLSLLIATCSFAPILNEKILRVDPNHINMKNLFQLAGFREDLNGIEIVHWLGTDDLGRDILARLLMGGNVSLTIGFLVMWIALLLGITLGLLAGYYGRWVDDLINSLIQIINNIPSFYLFLALSQLWKPDIFLFSLILGSLGWTDTARQVRALTLSLRGSEFVWAAKVNGATTCHILIWHLLPNISSIILLMASNLLAWAILSESSLSFLGFGIRNPELSWGRLLGQTTDYLFSSGSNGFLVWSPGIAICLTILSANIIAERLRDILDPMYSQNSRSADVCAAKY